MRRLTTLTAYGALGVAIGASAAGLVAFNRSHGARSWAYLAETLNRVPLAARAQRLLAEALRGSGTAGVVFADVRVVRTGKGEAVCGHVSWRDSYGIVGLRRFVVPPLIDRVEMERDNGRLVDVAHRITAGERRVEVTRSEAMILELCDGWTRERREAASVSTARVD